MAYITTYISDKLKPYSFYVLVVSLVIIFIFASLLFYYRFYANSKYNDANKNTNFTDVTNQQSSNGVASGNTIKLYYFHVTWCPYCIKAGPIIQSFKSKYDGKVINGRYLRIIETDLTIKDDPKVSNLIEKYDIDSYPTIFIIDEKGKRIDFDAKVTLDNLTKFVNSV